MAYTRIRSYSTYSTEAVRLLGKLVRAARIQQKMTATELAERAGISRDTLYRLEKGDPSCELGTSFEVATIVGLPLFEPELSDLKERTREVTNRLTLLPKFVRKLPEEVNDDF